MEYRKQIGRTGLIGFMVLLSAHPVGSYFSYGARAGGMGNAFSAVADDASAVYWNPASIVLIPGWSVTLDVGSDLVVADKAQNVIEKIFDSDPRAWDGPEFGEDRDRLLDLLDKLDDYAWTHRGGDRFGLSVAYKKTAFSIMGYDIYYIQPEVDTLNIDLDPESGTYIGNNATSMQFGGFHVKEYGMTLSFLTESKSVAMGVTGKFVDIDGYHWTGNIWDEPSIDPSNLLDRVENTASTGDSDWGMDASFTFFLGHNRVALVGRNLHSLEIRTGEDTTLKIKQEYRIGYAFIPNDRFTFAVDYETNASRDPLGNKLDGKDIAIGFEGKFGDKKNFVLRGGAVLDKGGDSPILFTGGASILFEHLAIDFSYSRDQDGESLGMWGGLRISF